MTQEQLVQSARFRAQFQFLYEEALAKAKGEAVDVMWIKGPDFALSPNYHSARFNGTVELGVGDVRGTAGLMFLHLPDGLEGNSADAILENATMEVIASLLTSVGKMDGKP